MYTFLILVTTIRTFSSYVSKDVRIRGYFSKRHGHAAFYFENVHSYADRFEIFLHNLLNIAWIEMYRLFSFAVGTLHCLNNYVR
jgi:hypothetical protein